MNPTVLFRLLPLLPAVSLVAQEVPPVGEAPAPFLNEAPAFPGKVSGPRARTVGALGGFTVAVSSREQSRLLYNTVHEASNGVPVQWTGSVSTGVAGTTSDEFKKAVILRVNFFRAMAGIPANVQLSSVFSVDAQKAALMMSANNSLSHTPPANWKWYSAEGANAAGQSNLALGVFGPAAVDGYISDTGAGNAIVGHRRWVLYPQTETMGTGDIPAAGNVPAANALWVFDENTWDPRPATRDPWVAWPPPGYVPYQTVYPRWSFGLANADLSGMTVTMKKGATNIPVTMETYSTFVGENTRAWVPTGLDPSTSLPPAADTACIVTVSGVKVNSVVQAPFVYTVTVFDPAVTGADTVVPALTGSAALSTGIPAVFIHPALGFADSYDLLEAESAAFSETEGAENGLLRMTAQVPEGHNPISTAIKAAGTRSFHLTNPGFQSQSLTWQYTLVPTAASRLKFKSRLGFATSTQTARAQISRDDGVSWVDVYTESGNLQLAGSFSQRDLSLTPWAGIPVRMRLFFDAGSGSTVTDTADNNGWYIDELTVTGATQLTNAAIVANGTGTTLTYTPSKAGQRVLYTRARVFQGYPSENGPVLPVAIVAGPALPPVLALTTWTTSGDKLALGFSITNAPAGAVYTLQTSTLSGAWSTVAGAKLENAGAGLYRFTCPMPATRSAFFRVKLN